MKLYTFQTSNKIVAGRQSLSQLSEQINVLGKSLKRALILSSPTIQKLGYVDNIQRQLSDKGISSFVNTEILPEPTIDNIKSIHELTSKENYDFIIGIGGGSILDAAKILAVLKTNHQSIEEMLGTEQVEKPGVPMILIPTTSGTGSEVTPNAIVTIPEEELKVGIVSKYLLPQLVIIDPELTTKLPKSITAATGMDAFTHSLESYISNKANPISDMFALESIRLISESIVTAYIDGSDMVAREKMLVGSMYGGMALTSAGTAAVHALAYPLGGKFKISHGVANSMLLPHVMEFNQDAIANRMITVAKAMSLLDNREVPAAKATEAVINQIMNWTKELEIPQDLKEFGVKMEDLDTLAIAASKVTRLLDNNPKKIELDEMKKIYLKLL